LKIAVVSDSHFKINYLKETISFLKYEGCEYLIHAGDIYNLELLKNS